MIEPGLLKKGERVLSLETPLLTEPEHRFRRGTVRSDVEVDSERTEVSVDFDGVGHRIVMPARTIRRLTIVERIGDLTE